MDCLPGGDDSQQARQELGLVGERDVESHLHVRPSWDVGASEPMM
jgi:hypothetical protein